MGKHVTRKSTPDARNRTIALKSARALKYGGAL